MKIRAKLLILLVLPLVVIGWMGFSGYQTNSGVAREMAQIGELMSLAVRVSELVHETQKERGLTAGYYGSGGKKFGDKLAAQRKNVDERLEALVGFLAAFDRSGVDDGLLQTLSDAEERLGRLAETRASATRMSIPAGEAIGYYTRTNAALLNTIGRIGQQSTDSAISRQVTAYQNFLKGKERAGIERAVLANTFAADKFGPGMYKRFNFLVAEQGAYFNEFALFAAGDALRDFEELSRGPEFSAVEAYRAKATAGAQAGGFGVDAGVWFETITSKINRLKGFEDLLSERLLADAGVKRAAARRASTLFAATTLAICLALVFAACLVIRSILSPLRQVIAQLRDCAEGEADLTRQADAGRRDEIGELAGWFNTFVNRIHDVIFEVTRSTGEVAAAAAEIAASSDAMSSGVQAQAAQLAELTSAVEEMAASVTEVSQKACDAASSAEDSGRAAGEGGSIVRETIEGMQSIHASVTESAASVKKLGDRGEQIGQIVTVINDIADQTNLLALNAAIEAARAGEHGRGFAVVADEVRKLADRTTKATEEITVSITAIQDETQLVVTQMSSGQEQVQQGVDKATHAGESLDQIVGSANQVAGMIQAIASTSEQQSRAAEQVTQNVQEITRISGRANAGITQAADAAGQLGERAEGLLRLVGQFRLNDRAGAPAEPAMREA